MMENGTTPESPRNRRFEPVRAAVRIFLSGVFCLWAAGPLQAEQKFSGLVTKPGAGIDLEVLLLLDRTPDYGFAPVRISIRNDSGKDQDWSFLFSTGLGFDDGLSLEYPHSVEVESGKTKTVDILVPLPGVRDDQRASRLQVKVSGYGMDNSTGYAPDRYGSYSTSSVGLSRSLFTNYQGAMTEVLKKRGTPFLEKSAVRDEFISGRAQTFYGRTSTRQLSATVLDFAKLPADWRSYSSLAEIQITGEEWQEVPKAQEQAIRDWMALGGRLVVTGPGGGRTDVPLGFGGRSDVGIDEGPGLAPILSNLVLELDADPAVPWKLDFAKGWGLMKTIGPLTVNSPLIIGFVVLFGIVIAPVNLFIFAPSRFRHRLFWTVPLISIVASVLLAAVIVLQDGFGGTGQRLAAVLILPEDHKMAVIQEQVVKTALLLGQQFALPEKVLLALVPTNGSSMPDGTVSRAGDQAGGEWFSSRTVKGYQLKTILPTRARVEIVSRSEDGTPVVWSSLPVNLKDFYLIDEQGKTWFSPGLATGERRTLQSGGGKSGEIQRLLVTKASRNLQKVLLPMLDRTGYFYAVAEGGEGVPLDTLGSIRWEGDQVIYLGAWTEGGS